MGNIPVLKPNEVIAILIKLGFTEVRQRGYTGYTDGRQVKHR